MAISPLQEEKVTMTLDAGVKVTIVGVESEDTNIIPIVYGNVAVAGTDDRIEIYYVDRILANKHYSSFLDSGGSQMFTSQQDALNWFSTNFFSDAPVPPGGVTSFNGRTGAVLPESGDYSLAQITEGNNAILQGGNSFGTTMSIGTNDNNNINFLINNLPSKVYVNANGFNASSSNIFYLNFGDSSSSATITRNTADVYSVFSFNNSNASSTGHILDFQKQSSTLSYIGNSGEFILGNTASVNGISLYNTADQTTNFEKGQLYWSGNVFNINTGISGTGVSRAMVVGRATRLTLDNFSGATGAANLGVGNYNSSAPIFSILGTLNSSSLMTPAFGPLITVNQTGSAGYRALWIPVYEQSIGGGDRLLIDAGTSTGAYGSGYTSKFSVSSLGNVYMPGTLTQTKNVTTSVGLSAGAYFNAYAYSGTGSQWAASFHTMTTVSGQSSVSELDGMLTALYHSAGFTLPKWKGIETGAVYVDGAGSTITESWGIEAKFPEVTNGGSVGTAAGVHIPSQATTGITKPYALFNEGTSSIMSRGAFEQYSGTTATVKGQIASDANGGYLNLWGASSVLIRFDGRGNNSYINSGNFGIGTTSPSSLFTVANNFSVDNAGVVSISNVMKLATITNSSPQDGDLWREDNTNTGLKIRINGVTKTITVS